MHPLPVLAWSGSTLALGVRVSAGLGIATLNLVFHRYVPARRGESQTIDQLRLLTPLTL